MDGKLGDLPSGFIKNVAGKSPSRENSKAPGSNNHSIVVTIGINMIQSTDGITIHSNHSSNHGTRWCPPSYKLVYNPINYRYITYKP